MFAPLTRRQFVTLGSGLFGAAALTAITGCAPSKPELTPSAEGVEPAVSVDAIDNRFDPPEVTVTAGDAVEWRFEGSVEHDVVADDESFVSPLQRQGTYVHVFDTPGEYPYLCSVHPEMRGRVIVT